MQRTSCTAYITGYDDSQSAPCILPCAICVRPQIPIRELGENCTCNSSCFLAPFAAQELITRTEEIDRLNTLVSQLQQQVQQQAHFPPQPSASEAAISEAATTHGLRPSHSHEHEQQHNQEQQQTPHSLNDASEKSVMW